MGRIGKAVQGTVRAIGKMRESKTAMKKGLAEAKSKLYEAKGSYIKAKGLKPVLQTAIRSAASTRIADINARSRENSVMFSKAQDAVNKWNQMINMNADPAEGTGDAKSGNSGEITMPTPTGGSN